MTEAIIKAKILDQIQYPIMLPILSEKELETVMPLLFNSRPIYKATIAKVTDKTDTFVGLVEIGKTSKGGDNR